MALYKGYSTVNRDFGPYALTDNDLIVQDLLNLLQIRKGEKLMNPSIGTIIWNRLFDPLTPALKTEIAQDINRVIAYDPRFNVVNQVLVQESPDGKGLLLNFQLQFSGTNQLAALNVLFDRSSNNLYVV
jgi:phage baseplate assembly protein W